MSATKLYLQAGENWANDPDKTRLTTKEILNIFILLWKKKLIKTLDEHDCDKWKVFEKIF